MSVKTRDRKGSRSTNARKKQTKKVALPAPIKRHLPAWLVLAAVLAILTPRMAIVTLDAGGRIISTIPGAIDRWLHGSSEIAPLFSPEVQHWGNDIDRWAAANDLDPNLLATVMQIESCGHPTINSYAGAQGLFQVMPFNFQAGDNFLDPETNAERGANVLKQCTGFANGDAGLAMACYNGGPSVLSKTMAQWSDQTRRYYYWGTGIYQAATLNQSYSPRLDEWLAAGGAKLCQMAGTALGI
ncbi:MAG: transglycosylase SLT domain-containing protein [Anaerolineaceae bacterium]|nr:transglycosylase SLT domain-containing protein [Anaerolineaceae bacterium]